MTEKHISTEDKKPILHKAKTEAPQPEAHPPGGEKAALTTLQQQVGNRAVQRLLAQRAGDGSFELDDSTAGRINSQRGGGQALDSSVQAQMGEATGHDFSGVKVHTDSESHSLNEDLGARAFTTGQDVFFRSGEYNPGSSGGQELLAHELTHVVQQSSGRVGGSSGKMSVNAPGDAYEQEADAVAKSVTSSGQTAGIQRQEMDEEELAQTKLQRQEEEELMTKRVQREEMPEEELMTKRVQREEIPEEELMTKRVQREAEEDELMTKRVQMEAEEDELMAKRIQREHAEEDEMAG